jgi:dihydrofolate reductase
MVILASAGLVGSFANLGFIDEYRILVHPIVLGAGKALFGEVAQRQTLSLAATKTYPLGSVLLRYTPTAM